MGPVVFDMKAKPVYSDALLFDVAEVQKLRMLARLFHLRSFSPASIPRAALDAIGCS